MYLWQVVHQAITAEKIATDQAAAKEWITQHIRLRDPYWSRRAWWPPWQEYCYALGWLARDRAGRQAGRVPIAVEDAVGQALAGVRLVLDGRQLRTMLSTRDGALAGYYHGSGGFEFDDLTTFWQAVFITFFDPGRLIGASVCEVCGRPLPQTKKLGKPSRARRCASCHHRLWRQAHPDRVRALWREAKRRERHGL